MLRGGESELLLHLTCAERALLRKLVAANFSTAPAPSASARIRAFPLGLFECTLLQMVMVSKLKSADMLGAAGGLLHYTGLFPSFGR